LLFLVLGFCPHDVLADQRTKKIEPLVTPVLPAEQAWQVSLAFPSSAGAAMDEERAYIPLEGEHFVAIDRATGSAVWNVDIESAWPPLVHDGIVFLAASDELHAIDGATGNHKWRVPLGRGAIAPMVIQGDVLLALTQPDEVIAFTVADGQRLWLRALGGRTGRAAIAADATGVSVGLVDRLVRLRMTDGAVRWDRMLPGQVTSVTLARDRVFAGSTSNEIFAFDPDRGSLAWRYPFGGDVIGIAASGDLVFVASLDNVVRALKRGNGNQEWKKALTIRPAAPPRVVDGGVVVAGVESVVAFNSLTGAQLGTFESPNLLQGMPAIDVTPAPFAVSIVAVTRDGRAIGLRPEGMMFREKTLEPLKTLPGRPLQKEPSPLP
jgi:outer membrane protein assembly factor BamB